MDSLQSNMITTTPSKGELSFMHASALSMFISKLYFVHKRQPISDSFKLLSDLLK